MNNPLYVLVKIGIAQIPNKILESKRDDLHEALRQDYPIIGAVRELHQQMFNITPNGTEVSKDIVPLLSMMDVDKEWAFRIQPDAFFIQTRAYSSYEDLQARLEKVLSLVNESVKVTHYQFVGIRYVNKYSLGNMVDFSHCIARQDFLQPNLAGLSMAGSNLLSVYVDGENTLNINSGVTVNNAALNGDLMDLAQDLGIDPKPLDGVYAHVDLDAHCSLKKPVVFSLDSVLDKINSLRRIAKKAHLEIVKQTT
ncbi:hypothetical protein CGX12_17875 [Zobellella denitrificans]|uniref:TIGR04255 family protein n=1 Tax=Zobellella denitrificans TaxID=347534 RepID=UPI000B8BED88|nr:TIGR04255 family protein [Zobellella denitrificans]OXS13778.1 hypothetical protein CGX12_17875 [Zobellella denitrificans]